MTDALFAVAVSFVALTAAPGPANLALATTTMARGRRAGVRMAVGLAAGLALWGVVAASGLAVLLDLAPGLLVAIKLGGGAYLLYLAVLSARNALSRDAGAAPGGDAAGLFRRGLALNLLNPKAVLAWTASLSLGLGAAPIWVAVALCAPLGLASYLGHAVVFSLGGVRAAYARARSWVEGATAAVLAAAGLSLVFWRIRPE